MAWTPPRLEATRIYLAAPEEATQPKFVRDGQSAAEQNLPGLPSNWKLYLKETDQPLGTIGFIRWEPEKKVGEIGFIMMNLYTGKGYMTEACQAVVKFGLGEMGLETIEAKSLPDNPASIRILEKIGMKKMGRIRGKLSSKGPELDLDLFVISKSNP
ncbi:MAG TPA: GNAT family N-acetyltransferase [Nitrospiria bacterium]|nr:GNAT family N-acetyltransferase [Nitrospiria bacterium]